MEEIGFLGCKSADAQTRVNAETARATGWQSYLAQWSLSAALSAGGICAVRPARSRSRPLPEGAAAAMHPKLHHLSQRPARRGQRPRGQRMFPAAASTRRHLSASLSTPLQERRCHCGRSLQHCRPQRLKPVFATSSFVVERVLPQQEPKQVQELLPVLLRPLRSLQLPLVPCALVRPPAPVSVPVATYRLPVPPAKRPAENRFRWQVTTKHTHFVLAHFHFQAVLYPFQSRCPPRNDGIWCQDVLAYDQAHEIVRQSQ